MWTNWPHYLKLIVGESEQRPVCTLGRCNWTVRQINASVCIPECSWDIKRKRAKGWNGIFRTVPRPKWCFIVSLFKISDTVCPEARILYAFHWKCIAVMNISYDWASAREFCFPSLSFNFLMEDATSVWRHHGVRHSVSVGFTAQLNDTGGLSCDQRVIVKSSSFKRRGGAYGIGQFEKSDL